MKKFILFLVGTMALSKLLDAQTLQDCGCSAALRYDIYHTKKNLYSEMLLARDINYENYRELQQKESGGLSILGIQVGENGENIERIKQAYHEKLLNTNVSSEMEEYESITTSEVSYNTYKDCMAGCFKSHAEGPQAYIVHEDGNSVDMDLYYGTVTTQRNLLDVTYYYNGIKHTIKAKPNQFNPIHLLRTDEKSFSIVFTSGLYKSQAVNVHAYKPLTASVRLIYSYSVEYTGKEIAYSSSTDNNDGRGCGITCPLYVNKDLDAVNSIVGKPDGPGRLDNVVENGGKFFATRLWFKATAPAGYSLRGPVVKCVGEGTTCDFISGDNYLINNTAQVIYTAKYYSAPVNVIFTVQTYRIDQPTEESWSFSTNTTISFVVPKTTFSGIINYGGGPLELGNSNEDFQLVGTPIETSDHKYKIYYYKILKPQAASLLQLDYL